MKVAVVGATGMVGRVMLKVLQERNFPVSQLIPVASQASVGKKVRFNDQEVRVESMEVALYNKPDVALFSAGSSTSLKWAPEFKEMGTTVIDNSSAWRMHEEVPLIVPEVNADVLTSNDKIIANPNCSTIQMVVALAPLHKAYGIKRLVVSTYQSVTGTGKAAVGQLRDERSGIEGERVYPHTIDLNCLPHCDIFLDNEYTKEEMKLVYETRKILRDNSLAITATAVRVPVIGGHSESINVEFNQDFDLAELKQMLADAPGAVVMDNISNNVYPMPLFAQHKDDVFIGRLRRDNSQDKALNMWVVSDNLRKGAATNAVQIAEYLLEKGILKAAK
ncbi:MAG: aspartate-semialdehyde dehydrogenase [Chitinophagales bacterium]